MKVTHGHSKEITEQISSEAATTFAQWIGSYTVIYNQKTRRSKADYLAWIEKEKPDSDRPVVNTQVAYLTASLPFLKEIPAQIRRNAGAKWFEALNAAKIGLRKHPQVKPKTRKRNCYVTNELFDVQPLDKDRCLIQIKRDATQKHKGRYLAGIVMPFPAENAGKSLYLSRKGSRFWLSMSFGQELDVLSEAEVKSLLASMTDEELDAAMTGYDLGVKQQVTGSDNTVYHLTEAAQSKLVLLEARKARYQRRYARMARANDKAQDTKKRPRTKAEQKLAAKIGKYSEKKAAIQHNNSHHISKAIADSTPLCAVFEDMKLTNLTRKPKAKACPDTGKWLRNGAAAKRGLNKAILNANMGQIRQFTAYKLREQGKILVKVKPHHSSQECSACGHTEKGNRPSQAIFNCLKCNYSANADDNASHVLKGRGKKLVRTATFSGQEKTVRKVQVRRKKAHELASSGGGEGVSLASASGPPRCPKFQIDLP